MSKGISFIQKGEKEKGWRRKGSQILRKSGPTDVHMLKDNIKKQVLSSEKRKEGSCNPQLPVWIIKDDWDRDPEEVMEALTSSFFGLFSLSFSTFISILSLLRVRLAVLLFGALPPL